MPTKLARKLSSNFCSSCDTSGDRTYFIYSAIWVLVTKQSTFRTSVWFPKVPLNCVSFARLYKWIVHKYGSMVMHYHLLKLYLCDRSHKCEASGVVSKGSNVKCGVPQGSILGPLFFLLYVNWSTLVFEHNKTSNVCWLYKIISQHLVNAL